MKKTKRPALPSTSDGAFLGAVRERLEGIEGERGERVDRAVTFRDLIRAGVVTISGKFQQLPSGVDPSDYLRLNVPIDFVDDPGAVFGDQPFLRNPTPKFPVNPTPVAGLSAEGGYRSVVIRWDPPLYRPHSHTEIARSEFNDFSTSTVVGGSPSGSYTDTVGGGKTYYYWARHISRLNVQGVWSQSVEAATAVDVEFLADTLQGQVDTNFFIQSLTTDIEKIPGFEQTLATHDLQLLDQDGRLIGHDDLLADHDLRLGGHDTQLTDHDARLDSIKASVDDILTIPEFDPAASYLTEDIVRFNGFAWRALRDLPAPSPTPVEGADWTQIGTYITYDDVLSANAVAIEDSILRIDQTEAGLVTQGQQISALQVTVDDPSTGVAANASAVDSLDTRVTVNEGEITSQSSKITVLESTVDDPITGVSANAGGLSLLETRVTSTEGGVTANSADITSLNGSVSDLNTGVSANTGAINALETRVTVTETGIIANSSDITSLESSVTALNSGVSGNATALGALETRVTSTEQGITANSSDITGLESSVTDLNAGVGANAGAISSLETRVTSTEGAITANSTDITGLEASVTTLDGVVVANSGAINSLETRVTVNENGISANSTDITTLESSVNGLNAGVSANAGAIDLLETRVTSTEGNITAASLDITALQSTVDNPTSGVNANATAIDSLSSRVTTTEDTITANAADINSLQVSVGDNSAAILQKAEASVVTDIDGRVQTVEAEYSVKLDVNGLVSGFGLANNGQTSVFGVAANAVYFVDPGSPSSAFDPATDYLSTEEVNATQFIFGYATIAGEQRFLINVPTAIPDATITSAKIDQGFFENLTVAQKASLKDVTIDGVIQSGKTVNGNPAWSLDTDGDLSLYSGSTGGSLEVTGDRIIVRDGAGNVRVIIGRL